MRLDQPPPPNVAAVPERTHLAPLWLLALNLYLLSPVLAERIWLRESDIPLHVFFSSGAASVLWLMLLHGAFRRPAVLHLVLLPFHAVVAADLFAIVHYRTRLSSSVLSVLLENAGDTGDFLVAHGAAIGAVLVPAVTLYGLCVHRLRDVERPRAPRLCAVAGVLLAVVYGPLYVACGDVVHLAAADRNAPFGVLPQGWLAWKVYGDLDAEQTHTFRFGALRSEQVNTPETYVLVIGESARPDH
jgi:glucan phosphoethanolaminetransferase (alkaline phosphatase superfamily)